MENKPKKKGMSTLAKFGIGCGGLFVLFIIIGVASSYNGLQKDLNGTKNNGSNPNSTNSTSPAKEEPKVPAEYKSALSQAGTYSKTMHMSKQGVYDQLVSEFGGKFSKEAAQYAIDNVSADWNANALAQAKTYQDTMHLSPSAIKDQLISQYGAKFTQAEADYAIQHLND